MPPECWFMILLWVDSPLRAPGHQRCMHKVGERLSAWYHLHCGTETPSHTPLLCWQVWKGELCSIFYFVTCLSLQIINTDLSFLLVDWKKWEYSCRDYSWHQHHSPLWVWLLPVQPCRHTGTRSWSFHSVRFFCICFPSNFHCPSPGYQPAVPLLRLMGRQSLHGWRVADSNLPVVPHLRALYALSLHPCAGLLCSSCGLPCPLPSGRQRTWQVSALMENILQSFSAEVFLTNHTQSSECRWVDFVHCHQISQMFGFRSCKGYGQRNNFKQ